MRASKASNYLMKATKEKKSSGSKSNFLQKTKKPTKNSKGMLKDEKRGNR